MHMHEPTHIQTPTVYSHDRHRNEKLDTCCEPFRNEPRYWVRCHPLQKQLATVYICCLSHPTVVFRTDTVLFCKSRRLGMHNSKPHIQLEGVSFDTMHSVMVIDFSSYGIYTKIISMYEHETNELDESLLDVFYSWLALC